MVVLLCHHDPASLEMEVHRRRLAPCHLQRHRQVQSSEWFAIFAMRTHAKSDSVRRRCRSTWKSDDRAGIDGLADAVASLLLLRLVMGCDPIHTGISLNYGMLLMQLKSFVEYKPPTGGNDLAYLHDCYASIGRRNG